MRIVSLDFCADQYVLKLADREQILAVSPDAVREFSYMRETAQGLPTVRSVAEDVLILKPDLVVRSYGGGPKAGDFFERAGKKFSLPAMLAIAMKPGTRTSQWIRILQA